MIEAIERNEASTSRLHELAQRSEADLTVLVHDHWTVAAKLAHLAFWDRIALAVLERWARGDSFRLDVPHWYDDVLNDAVLAESLALHPAVAARLAAEAASRLDETLRGLAPWDALRLETDAANPTTDADWLLHRHRHREEHIQEICTALDASNRR